MKAVVQRVKKASVKVDHQLIGSIDKGYMILLGIKSDDSIEDAEYLSRKIANLRIFEDDQGKMNKSITDMSGSILLVSQFTLYGTTVDGNRPSFTEAARPEIAIPLYELMIDLITHKYNIPVATGIFGANMDVELINDGPCTIILESKK
ncbi:MAG: D-tyrosyl-tRNA(Tyr) deacylase [Tenericutes bacterium HGW-Tenericutes-1]|jgi:D-tyrosyl-tRNA(Tyr) deacylase|nr:MAG: D-tyrosyl-tRNA(Tyr) deacylase [Tenericutes bacterium HGW-Tenericutes-1]